VTGRGDARVTPDRAFISFATETRRATANAAGIENARLARGVVDTLRALGIAADDISTANYGVTPDQQYDNTTRQSRVVGYIVRNTIRVRVLKLEKVGVVLDAVLAKGVNIVSELELSASNPDDARRVALADAVDRARKDAEVIAKAAGGQVVGLLEVTTIDDGGQAPRGFALMKSMSASDAGPTPIQGGAQTLSAQVTTRWRFAPGVR
jgi:uncharacterized protein YggE